MPEASSVRKIRRVLVALDASPGSLAAARAAAQLASRVDAELAGLFVEDLRLLDLCASELAHQVDTLTGSATRVRDHDLERQFRSQASRARAVLSTTAHAAGVSWSFRVARGEVCDEIKTAAGEVDLVSLGRLGWSLRHGKGIGRIARMLLGERDRCTLLAGRRVEIRPPVAVLYGGSEPGRVALRLADNLAGDQAGSLRVLLAGDDPDALRTQAGELLTDRQHPPRFTAVGKASSVRIARLVEASGAGLLVLPLESHAIDQEVAQGLLERIDCPLLAVS